MLPALGLSAMHAIIPGGKGKKSKKKNQAAPSKNTSNKGNSNGDTSNTAKQVDKVMGQGYWKRNKGNLAELGLGLGGIAALSAIMGGGGGGTSAPSYTGGSPVNAPSSAVDFGTSMSLNIGNTGARNTAFGTGGLAGSYGTGVSLQTQEHVVSRTDTTIRVRTVDTFPLFLADGQGQRTVALAPGRSSIPTLDRYGSTYQQYKIHAVSATIIGQGLTLTTIPSYHAVQLTTEQLDVSKMDIDCFRSLPNASIENINNNVSASWKPSAQMVWRKIDDEAALYVNVLRDNETTTGKIFVSIATDYSFYLPTALTCTYDRAVLVNKYSTTVGTTPIDDYLYFQATARFNQYPGAGSFWTETRAPLALPNLEANERLFLTLDFGISFYTTLELPITNMLLDMLTNLRRTDLLLLVRSLLANDPTGSEFNKLVDVVPEYISHSRFSSHVKFTGDDDGPNGAYRLELEINYPKALTVQPYLWVSRYVGTTGEVDYSPMELKIVPWRERRRVTQ